MSGPNSEHPNEAVFVGYWGKMLARYAGITEKEYDVISEGRRKRKMAERSCQ